MKSSGKKTRLCVAYDEEGVCIGVGESVKDLAEQMHVLPTTIYHCIRKGSPRYAFVDIDDDEEGSDDVLGR